MRKIYLLYEYHGTDGKEVIAVSEREDLLVNLMAAIQNKNSKEITEVLYDEPSGTAIERSLMMTGGALILKHYKRLFSWEGPKE